MRTLRIALAAAVAGLLALPVAAQDVTLTVHHFLSPKSATHTQFIEPWARSVEAASGGRIAVKVFPSMTMGGKPPELYRQVRDGVADIVWTLPGYTPGVFPRVEVFELPAIHRGSARQTTLAIQDLMPELKDDFADIHPILIHTHAGNALHITGGPIASVEDLGGLKLRTPSRTGGWMIESWGAEPVGMPVPALPQALSKKVVDGALVPFEIVPPLKLHELTRTSIEGPGGLRFGTSIFLLAMNKARYDSLPADLRAIIDAHSGMNIAAAAGETWDGIEGIGKKLQAESDGGQVQVLDPALYAALQARSAAVTTRWIDDATAKGIDAAGLVARAKAAMEVRGE